MYRPPATGFRYSRTSFKRTGVCIIYLTLSIFRQYYRNFFLNWLYSSPISRHPISQGDYINPPPLLFFLNQHKFLNIRGPKCVPNHQTPLPPPQIIITEQMIVNLVER